MKTILITILCLFFVCTSFAQVGNKPLGNKLPAKNLGTSISVKPSNLKLKDIGLPKSFDVRKTSKLEVPADKLKLPSRKKMKITPIKPYQAGLEFYFIGAYSKDYFWLSDGGVITVNAQKGKEYRIKVSLADKNDKLDYGNYGFPNGNVFVRFGNETTWFTIPVNQSQREFNLVFTATQAGNIQVRFFGIVPPGIDSRVILENLPWLPIKSIEVDEI